MSAVALRGESRVSPAMRRRRSPLAIAAVLLSAAAVALLWALVAGDLPVVATDVLGLTSPLAENIAANGVGLALANVFRYFAYRHLVFFESR